MFRKFINQGNSQTNVVAGITEVCPKFSMHSEKEVPKSAEERESNA